MKLRMDGHTDGRKEEKEGPTDYKLHFLLPKRWLFEVFKFVRSLDCYIFSQMLMKGPLSKNLFLT